MLNVFGGLPGAGKTTFAYEVSRRLSAITRDSWIEVANRLGHPSSKSS
jgi:adenylate kinase family enzyme